MKPLSEVANDFLAGRSVEREDLLRLWRYDDYCETGETEILTDAQFERLAALTFGAPSGFIGVLPGSVY